MAESMRAQGMRDLTPEEMERFRRTEDRFREVCLGWGYREIRTPTIEPLHLFTAAGTLSPHMLERVYSFLDWDGWSGERVVLRPDSTIPAVRLYMEQPGREEVAKLFYVQNVFRFEPGDASREEWQCGVELIGEPQPGGDAELVLMACEVLERLGVPASVKLSDPGILRTILETAGFGLPEQMTLYDRVLDGDVAALDEVQARVPGLSASLSALLSIEGEGVAYLDNLRAVILPVIPAAARPIDELAAVSEILAGVGLAHAISPVLVRNFEYYTGPVFHIHAGTTKVGGGGRYDALVSLVGGKNTPASGFALEAGALAGLLPATASGAGAGVTIRYSAGGGADLGGAFALARALRTAGRQVTVTSDGEPGSRRDVVVSSGDFILRLNGSPPRRLTRLEDVVDACLQL